MNNDTEKLNKFKNAVFENAELTVRKITEKAKLQAEDKIKNAALEAQEYEKENFEAEDRKEQIRKAREISSVQLNEKRRLLLHREKIIETTFEKIKEKLSDFKNTDEYETFLLKKLKECSENYPEEKGTVYLCPQDLKFSDKLSLNGRFKVSENKTFELGGLMIVFENKNIAFDYTFDSAVSEERKNFTGRQELTLNGGDDI